MNIKCRIRTICVSLCVAAVLLMCVLVLRGSKKIIATRTTNKDSLYIVKPLVSTQDTPHDMQRYENKEYGFVMYYPIGWSSNTTTDGNANPAIFTPERPERIGFQIEQIYVDFSKEFPYSNTKEYVQKEIFTAQKGSVCEGGHTLNRNVPVTLQTQDVTIVEGLCGMLDQGPLAVIKHKGRRISISSSMSNNITTDVVYRILEKVELN